MRTITLTFGDRGENHAGMQIIGELGQGLTPQELAAAMALFARDEFDCEMHDLNQEGGVDDAAPARVLVVRNGVNVACTERELFNEQRVLPVDKYAKMYGRVVNKRARWNLCFADFAQEPDYEQGKGRIIDFRAVPFTSLLRQTLGAYIPGAERLICEGNYYHELQSYIGWHGDAERRRVIAVRLGAPMNLYYRWYRGSTPVGQMITIALQPGDVYIMSDKAVGWDWRSNRTGLTLRHAAGNTPP